jgi:nucleoid DNA-binding protein
MLLPGLGVLRVVTLKARTARNPKTGETVQVPRKKTVRFRPHGELRAAVNPGQAASAEGPGAPEPAAEPAPQKQP